MWSLIGCHLTFLGHPLPINDTFRGACQPRTQSLCLTLATQVQLPSGPHDILRQRRGQPDVHFVPPPTAGFGWDAALTDDIWGASRLALSLSCHILGLWERSCTSLVAEPPGGPPNTQVFRFLPAVPPGTQEALSALCTPFLFFRQSTYQTDWSPLPGSPRMPPFCHLFVFIRFRGSGCFYVLSILDWRKQADSLGSSSTNSWA